MVAFRTFFLTLHQNSVRVSLLFHICCLMRLCRQILIIKTDSDYPKTKFHFMLAESFCVFRRTIRQKERNSWDLVGLCDVEKLYVVKMELSFHENEECFLLG